MQLTTPNQSPGEMYTLAIVFPLLATAFTVLRFMARRKNRTAIMWDDWTLVISLVFTYITAILMIVATARGDMAQHMTITPKGYVIDERFVVFLKILWAIQLPSTLGRIFNIISWILIGIMGVWIIAFFFGNMLECTPISESWSDAPGLEKNPHCIRTIPMYLAQVYSDVIMDVLILLLPMPLIWKLQLPTKQKIAVCGMFLLGFITTLSSCAKMIVYYLVSEQMAQKPDLAWFMTPVIYWPLIESGLQIIAACLPLLRPLMPSWFSNSTKKTPKGWDSGSPYSGTPDAKNELGTTTTSHSTQANEMRLDPPSHGSEDYRTDAQGIYVQRSFNTQRSNLGQSLEVESDTSWGLHFEQGRI